MGDPRRVRVKFEGPRHPWQKERIEQEKKLLKEFGLKNKSEFWRTDSGLKNFATQAKRLVALTGEQAEKEKTQLLQKLNRLGLLENNAQLEDVLGLKPKDMLERRLQTIVCRKGFAKTMNQARQFITHGHVTIKGKKVTAPSYLVPIEEEPTIAFVQSSALSNPEHAERQPAKTKAAEEETAKKEPIKKTTKKEPAKKAGKTETKKETKEQPAKKTEKKEDKK